MKSIFFGVGGVVVKVETTLDAESFVSGLALSFHSTSRLDRFQR
jgi:hypothetical protein